MCLCRPFKPVASAPSVHASSLKPLSRAPSSPDVLEELQKQNSELSRELAVLKARLYLRSE
jgi:hypothetical protein